ncbi:MAG: hypothetical protein ABIC82_06685 [bacterium]
MLFIPESRKRPITKSLLYKQIIRFFEEEGIRDRFEIAFITINDGVISDFRFQISDFENHKSKIINRKFQKLPPANFRSGRLWITKEQIEQMADSIVDFIKTQEHKNIKTIAYCRGSYLEAVRLASKKSGIEIKEIFSDDELAQLKKKGILWMKVGLRMPTPFIIFRMKIREFIKEDNDDNNDNKNKQLTLF